jgi:hypothetical protein
MSLYTLASLAAFRTYLGLATTEGNNEALLQALRAATQYLERSKNRRFAPYYDTRHCTPLPYDMAECVLGEDLLELTTLIDGDGTAIPVDETLILYDGILHLIGRSFTFEDTPHGAIEVSGIWGYHDFWGQAWRVSNDALVNAVNDTATTFTISDPDGADRDEHRPRFSAGQLVRVGNEYVVILATDSTANTLTVSRGANGSSAVAHSAATTLQVFAPAADIVQDCLRWAARFYREAWRTDAVEAAESEGLVRIGV